MGDYLDCDMVAKKAYVYSGSINRSVELRKREDFSSVFVHRTEQTISELVGQQEWERH